MSCPVGLVVQFGLVAVSGVLGTPVSDGEASDLADSFCTLVNVEGMGEKTSTVSILALDGIPFNALALFHFSTVAASGDFSGELMHCAATRPGVGPLRFGG